MTRPRNIQSLLGTERGDEFLRHPHSANDLYRSLVGSPMKDSVQQAIGAPSEGEPPWDVFDPCEYEERPSGVIAVYTERVPECRPDTAFFSSHDHTPGVGYPSCSRALARIAKVCHDVNGYYRRLGLQPDCTVTQLRKKFATLYRRYHPDTGWAADTEEFMYLREIAAVLLNERRRARYDALRPGEKWMDSRVRSQLPQNDPLVTEFIKKCDEQQQRMESGGKFQRVRIDEDTIEQPGQLGDGGIFRADRQHAMAAADRASGNDHYDWFSDGERYGDRARAQLWYHHLVHVAPLVGYTRALRVHLTESAAPDWVEFGGILRIPRWWPIGSAEAFALFTCVVHWTRPGDPSSTT